jgi:hypothetical protein
VAVPLHSLRPTRCTTLAALTLHSNWTTASCSEDVVQLSNCLTAVTALTALPRASLHSLHSTRCAPLTALAALHLLHSLHSTDYVLNKPNRTYVLVIKLRQLLEFRTKSQFGLLAIIENIKSEVFRRVLPEEAPTNMLLLVIINTVRTQHMFSSPEAVATALPPSLGTSTPLTMKAQSRKWQQLMLVSDIVMSWPERVGSLPRRYASGNLVKESRMTRKSLLTSLVARHPDDPTYSSLTNKDILGDLDAPLPAPRHECTVCDESFTSRLGRESSSLRTHYENVHPDVGHMCSECGVVLAQLQSLDQHLRLQHAGGSRKGGRGTGWQGRWW